MFDFFREKTPSKPPALVDIVKKINNTGHVFWNINDDLGMASDDLGKSSNDVMMAYAYARRAAVAGMYIQGIVDKEVYDYVVSIFQAMQRNTDHTKDFQVQAFADSISFMQTYSPMVTGFFVKKMIAVAENYDIEPGRLGDTDLFKAVLDAAHAEQEQVRLKAEAIVSADIDRLTEGLFASVETESRKPSAKSHDRIWEIISELTEISERSTKKEVTMHIQPIDEHWSCELNFSDEELNLTHDLTDELNYLMNFRIVMPLMKYREKSTPGDSDAF